MSERDALTCRDFVEVIMAWLDGELEPAARQLFETHLEACPDCVNYLESYKVTVALEKCVCDADGPDGPDGPVPDDVPEELVQAVLAARRQR